MTTACDCGRSRSCAVTDSSRTQSGMTDRRDAKDGPPTQRAQTAGGTAAGAEVRRISRGGKVQFLLDERGTLSAALDRPIKHKQREGLFDRLRIVNHHSGEVRLTVAIEVTRCHVRLVIA